MEEADREALVGCMEAGANARRAGLQHAHNPHLVRLKARHDAGFDTSAELARCEAWWDGWEEVNRKLCPRDKPRLDWTRPA